MKEFSEATIYKAVGGQDERKPTRGGDAWKAMAISKPKGQGSEWSLRPTESCCGHHCVCRRGLPDSHKETNAALPTCDSD